MATYRQKLEKQRDELLDILSCDEQELRGTLRRQLGHIAEELDQIDAGQHWTQQETDTRLNIKLDLSRKTIKQMNQE